MKPGGRHINVLYAIQDGMNRVSAHPLTFVGTSAFLAGWLCEYFMSHGRFDPGLGVGNLIINGLGLLLVFSACSLSARNHDKISEIHERVYDDGGADE